MNKETLLILQSAEHWLENFNRAEKGREILTGPLYCPLCNAYPWGTELICGNCPIVLDTKQYNCRGTPYYRVIDAIYDKTSNREKLLKAVAAEYTYLIDLAFRHHEEHPA